jgi:hypothetical protein
MATPARRLVTFVVCLLVAPAFAGGEPSASWEVPRSWKSGPARPMRTATYLLPPVSGDPQVAECAVFYFQPGLGGSVEATLEHWVKTFERPMPSAPAQTTHDGLTVTTFEVEGTLKADVPQKDFKLLGAIVQGPKGSYFFRLIGPRRTVTDAKRDFTRMIDGLHG